MADDGRQPREVLAREMLDAYLDGQLSGADRAAFERAMMADPALRQEVEQQREIDASLGRLFGEVEPAAAEPVRPAAAAAAAAISVSAAAAAATDVGATDVGATGAGAPAEVAASGAGPRPIDYRNPKTRGPIKVPWPLAAAAIILFTVGMSYAVWQYLQGPTPPPPFVQRISLDQQYRTEVNHGFRASWKCKDEQEFMSTFTKQYGEPLAMDDPPAGVECLGLSYNAVMSPRTTYLLARVGDDDVVVFIDRAGCGGGANEQALKQPAGLHVFNKQVGDFVLYEVTPLDKAHLLDLFHVPTIAGSPGVETTN